MNESNGSWLTTKQGITNSQIQKKSVHGAESASDPDVLEEINSVGPRFVV